MKVLMINGSPHPHGTTRRALDEMASTLKESGVETEIITVGNKAIRGCIACWRCDGRCRAFDDEVNVALGKMEAADGLVIASPVYFASPNGTLISFLDRMFAAGDGDKAFADALYKYPMISGMPVVSSCYWPMVHGSNAAQAEQDEEGMQVMRNLGRNLAWMLACIELGKKGGATFPAGEKPRLRTDFIR